jgi:hypothetical protein
MEMNNLFEVVIVSYFIWLGNMNSYIKGGEQSKDIAKHDPGANMLAHEGWEYGMEKASQSGTS